MKIGVYPGTFDPITTGHMDIIRRAVRLVDRLIVGVAENEEKHPLFSLDERVRQVAEEIGALGPEAARHIDVKPFNSLLMHFAEQNGATVIIRGLRAVSDFEYECQMAGINAKLDPEIETLFLMAADGQQFISSRFVKQIGLLGGDVSHFVSPRIVQALTARVAAQASATTPA